MSTAEEILADISPYLVKLEDFELIKKIGEGAFGVVYLAIHRATGIKCAVKKLISDDLEGNELIYFCREVKILSVCNSCFLLPLSGFTYSSPYLIVTEFMEGGNLFDALHPKRGAPHLTSTEKTVIAMGIAHGMMNLHKMKIIHRDLKSLNILLNKNRLPKICDFGIARFLDDACTLVTQQIGTTQWMAPEQLMTSKYTNKVDVYAYGILLWEIVAEDIPFRGLNQYQITINVTQKNLRPKIPDGTPKKLKQMIELCWNSDPMKRPTFKQIYKSFATHAVAFPDTDRAYVDAVVNDVQATEASSDMFAPISTRNAITREQYDSIQQETRSTYNPESTSTIQMPAPSSFNLDNEDSDDDDSYQSDESFDHCLTSLLNEATKENIASVYSRIEPKFEDKNNKQVRSSYTELIAKIAEKDQQLIATLPSTKILSNLPFDEPSDFPFICRIMSALIAVNPGAITATLTMKCVQNANTYTAEILHLFSKYALVADKQDDAFEIISNFLVVSSSYLTRGYTQDFIRILVFLLKLNKVFATEYKQYATDLLTHLLKNGTHDEIEFSFIALTQTIGIIPLMPMDVVIPNIATHTQSVVAYILNADIPPSVDLITALLGVAKSSQLALATLCKYAECITGSAMFLIAKGWLEPSCDTLVSFHIFLSILTVTAMRPAVSELSGVPELFTRLVQLNNADILIAIASAIKRITLSPQLVTKLSNCMFTSSYLQATVVTQRIDLVRAGLIVVKELASIAFTPEMTTMSEIVTGFIYPDTDVTDVAISAAAALSQYKESIPILKQKGLKDALQSAAIPRELETLKEEIIRNLC